LSSGRDTLYYYLPMNSSSLIRQSPEMVAAENARFMSKVYFWMTVGIFLSGTVSFFVGNSPELLHLLVANQFIFLLLIFAQFGAVILFSALIHRVSATGATALYLIYSFLTGLTLSVIFIVYTRSSIFYIFGLTAFAFAGLSAVGFFTKKDLSPIGSFCVMGLWGLVGFGLMSLFFPSLMGETGSQVYSIIGLIVFSGLTAYDTQKIKQLNILGNFGTDEDNKEAIHGALILYLDFINLFLSLLRLMGSRRR